MILISSIYQKFLKTSLELYGWQFDMEEIPALFDSYYVRAFKNFISTQLTVKSRDCNTLLGNLEILPKLSVLSRSNSHITFLNWTGHTGKLTQLSCLGVPAWLCYFCQANKFIHLFIHSFIHSFNCQNSCLRWANHGTHGCVIHFIFTLSLILQWRLLIYV